MKVQVLTENGISEKNVECMSDIQKIIGGQHEIVKMRLDLGVLYIANLNSSEPLNPHFPPYRGVVVKAPDHIVFNGAFYDTI